MPAELPGFYYDSERNRYFPISSKRCGSSQSAISFQDTTAKGELGFKSNTKAYSGVLQLVYGREVGGSFLYQDTHSFERRYMETQTSHSKVWMYEGANAAADGALEHLCTHIQTDEGLKEASVLTWGDNNGWFGACKILPSHAYPDCYIPQHFFPQSQLWNGTERPLNLFPLGIIPFSQSRITAIKRMPPRLETDQDSPHVAALVSTLGSAYQGGSLYIMKWNNTSESHAGQGLILPFNFSTCITVGCSIWTAALCGSMKATLGTSRGVAFVDLERPSMRWICRTRSDVLSQQCDSAGNVILCGFRNGNISTFDVRVAASKRSCTTICLDSFMSSMTPKKLQSHNHVGKFPISVSNFGYCQSERRMGKTTDDEIGSYLKPIKMRSAICSMVLLHSDETYLLASAMNGDIHLWDRRLTGKEPLQSYEGNSNTHSMLQIGVDPTETLLTSGGEDCTLRIWNVKSGQLLYAIDGFKSPVNTIACPRIQRSYNLHNENSTHVEPLMEQDHAWGMWLGSYTGLLYLHGAGI
eukprot:c25694_g1_i1 orf=406-1983(-)